MQQLIAVLTFSLVAVSDARASEPVDAHDAYLEAERDFADVRAELNLSRSAPLAGLEEPRVHEPAWEQEARRDFESVYGELGLSGSAPLVGLERYEFTVRPQVPHVILATASVPGR
jgi:hypothetical protein